ncbi:MAG: heparinase II/III family protein [Armatimonadetes bacterium]|nr:heparinase II/III family protein [Armatimonadota bacterium]
MPPYAWIPVWCGLAAQPAPAGWAALADQAAQRPDLAEPLHNTVNWARKVTANPIVKRVHRYEDIGRDRSWLDGRAKFMGGQPRQAWFGLAMSDFGATNILLTELPLLAFAYRCTREEPFRARIEAQLRETATWSPLQRPGWQLCVPAPDPVPADYDDGSWLATGQGVRALADTLELLPDGALPADVTAGIHALLRAEIPRIRDDWKLHHGWFRSGDGRPQTNQWVLPTEGLIRACLAEGRERFAAEYELGVANLLRAMDVQGRQGEFNEGIGYAMFTVGSMLAAAHAMAADGDLRALNHPFLSGFPTWAVEHLQPGRFRVNCFDGGGARTPRDDWATRGLLSTLVAFTGSPVARFALNRLYDSPSTDLVGLLTRASTGPEEAPPLFACYDGPARRVNWRESWDDAASGVWIRGGHPLDSHDHFDRGHVNFIAAGQPLLIEAGTPSYDTPGIDRLYQSVAGHNVLEVTGLAATRSPAPITVARLGPEGGDVTVDPTACYPGLERWLRHVVWDKARLAVDDEVAGVPGRPAALLFRWHLGTQAEAEVSGDAGRWTVRWPEGEITLDSSLRVQVTAEKLPDNTVCLGQKDNGWDFLHTCVVVRTAEPAETWRLSTTVTPR